VFRAEKSHTTRHLTEFTGIDAEMNAEELKTVMDVNKNFFVYVLGKLQENDKELLEKLNIKINCPKEFPVIKFHDALKLLKEQYNHEIKDDDLDPEGERLLGKHFSEKDKSDFVFVTDYPISARPFYHNYNADGKTTNSYDLLYKGQEIVTGAIREHRLELFLKQAEEKGIDVKTLEDYSVILKYGVPVHGGFGMGLDRIVQKIADVDNVKEVVLFPRDPERVKP
ncbi:MAG: aspartate--tRNA(Asn) ligase, partial [Candidatus Aenigmarchaeota archaeon]|nr:aspartate--tRNA(Asn) ligase [Candidatus Aenigmarchaeota archaeon]